MTQVATIDTCQVGAQHPRKLSTPSAHLTGVSRQFDSHFTIVPV